MDRSRAPPRQAILSLVRLKERCGPAHNALIVCYGSKADILAVNRHVRFTPKSRHWNSIEKCPLCARSGLMHCSKKAPSRIEFWVRSPAQARSAPSPRPARRRVLDAIGTGLGDCGRVWSNKLNGASFCQRQTCNFDYSKCVISTCLHRLSPMCRWRARYLNTRMSMR